VIHRIVWSGAQRKNYFEDTSNNIMAILYFNAFSCHTVDMGNEVPFEFKQLETTGQICEPRGNLFAGFICL